MGQSASVHPVHEMSVACKLVYKVLEIEDDYLTQAEIAEETRLADSTVRSALTRLQRNGVIDSRPDIRDARRLLYGTKPLASV